MIDPSIESLLDPKKDTGIESKFELINLIAKRVKQVNNKAKIMVNTDDRKPVSIAMREIDETKVVPIKRDIK